MIGCSHLRRLWLYQEPCIAQTHRTIAGLAAEAQDAKTAKLVWAKAEAYIAAKEDTITQLLEALRERGLIPR